MTAYSSRAQSGGGAGQRIGVLAVIVGLVLVLVFGAPTTWTTPSGTHAAPAASLGGSSGDARAPTAGDTSLPAPPSARGDAVTQASTMANAMACDATAAMACGEGMCTSESSELNPCFANGCRCPAPVCAMVDDTDGVRVVPRGESSSSLPVVGSSTAGDQESGSNATHSSSGRRCVRSPWWPYRDYEGVAVLPRSLKQKATQSSPRPPGRLPIEDGRCAGDSEPESVSTVVNASQRQAPFSHEASFWSEMEASLRLFDHPGRALGNLQCLLPGQLRHGGRTVATAHRSGVIRMSNVCVRRSGRVRTVVTSVLQGPSAVQVPTPGLETGGGFAHTAALQRWLTPAPEGVREEADCTVDMPAVVIPVAHPVENHMHVLTRIVSIVGFLKREFGPDFRTKIVAVYVTIHDSDTRTSSSSTAAASVNAYRSFYRMISERWLSSEIATSAGVTLRAGRPGVTDRDSGAPVLACFRDLYVVSMSDFDAYYAVRRAAQKAENARWRVTQPPRRKGAQRLLQQQSVDEAVASQTNFVPADEDEGVSESSSGAASDRRRSLSEKDDADRSNEPGDGDLSSEDALVRGVPFVADPMQRPLLTPSAFPLFGNRTERHSAMAQAAREAAHSCFDPSSVPLRSAPREQRPRLTIVWRSMTRRFGGFATVMPAIAAHWMRLGGDPGVLLVEHLHNTPAWLHQRFSNSDVTVGTFGTGLMWGFYMPPGAVLVELFREFGCSAERARAADEASEALTTEHLKACEYAGSAEAFGVKHMPVRVPPSFGSDSLEYLPVEAWGTVLEQALCHLRGGASNNCVPVVTVTPSQTQPAGDSAESRLHDELRDT